jgi:ankyrin repeat protein
MNGLGTWTRPRLPLTLAALEGDVGKIRELLRRREDINGAEPDGITPLIGAAVFGHTAVVRHLVGVQGVELDKGTVHGCTALLMAAENGHAGVVEVLIGAGCDVNKATTREQFTPLYAAAGKGRLDVIELLLRAGCDVNKTCWDDTTPLYIAAMQGHLAVCRRLLRVPGIDDELGIAQGLAGGFFDGSARPSSVGAAAAVPSGTFDSAAAVRVACCRPGCSDEAITRGMCGRCGAVVYCSVACQKLHWPAHKANCRFRPAA